jgi:hypothetical protein
MDCSLVEMGQAEQSGCQQKCGISSHPSFKQILQPSAEEQFFRNGDEEEGEQECSPELKQARPGSVKMQEAETQPDRDRDRRIKDKFAQSDANVRQAQA